VTGSVPGEVAATFQFVSAAFPPFPEEQDEGADAYINPDLHAARLSRMLVRALRRDGWALDQPIVED
jgi:hypothetical protein